MVDAMGRIRRVRLPQLVADRCAVPYNKWGNFRFLAVFGPGAMSGLSPQCAPGPADIVGARKGSRMWIVPYRLYTVLYAT